MSDTDEYVVPIEIIRYRYLGASNQAINIYNYLKNTELDAKTAIIERKYIDKDFFKDYAGFYARSFEKIERCTKRIHFFAGEFTQEDFEDILISYSNEKLTALGKYLGFVVIKQFKDQNKNLDPQIGRTLLVPYPATLESTPDERKYIWSQYKPNLYGIELCVDTLPFQAQDHAVAACATTSLWIANNQLMKLFQTPQLSPIEVTNRAASLIEYDRNLLSKGWTVRQMLAFLKSIELDFEYINISDLREDKDEIRDLIPDTVKAFVDAGIPIIAGLSLIKYDGDEVDSKTGARKEFMHDAHAVVISGYRQGNLGELIKLYIHDDQIGPYSKVGNKSKDGFFLEWENEWVTDSRYGPFPNATYDKVILDDFFLPLYPKIRLSYREVYHYCYLLRKKYVNFDFQLKLITINDFKKLLIKSDIRNKSRILKETLPKFMYVIRAMQNGTEKIDFVIDATSHKLCVILEVNYN